MIFSLLIITVTQLLALGNAAPQFQDETQLCHEADGRVSDKRWAEMFGVLGIIGEQRDGISKYFFVINEYEGHYLVRQNGCYQEVEEASDLENEEPSCVDMTRYAVLGGLDTDIDEFKQFARRMQVEITRQSGTMSLMIPTVTGDRTFSVVVDTDGIRSAPLQINNAWWECQTSPVNPDYNECLWRPTREVSDWKIQPYMWNTAEEVDEEVDEVAVADVVDEEEEEEEEDMDSDESEMGFDMEDFQDVQSID